MQKQLNETDFSCPKLDIDASLEKLRKRKKDLCRYAEILTMSKYPRDGAFRRKYSGFYCVRRNAAWREEYFRLMEDCQKSADVTFEGILRRMFQATGRIEASFSSKMLSTLEPDMPIWDSVVLTVLQLHLTGNDPKTRISNAVALYSYMCRWYQSFLRTAKAAEWIERFDREFPEHASFSPTKKIDFILWASR